MTNVPGSSSAGGPAPSRDAAFVVHLTRVAGRPAEEPLGRVEHVRTGRAARFDSAEELLRFMWETLAAIDGENR